ncbi:MULTISPECIES: hypothetical protein [Moorena]|uniref:Uncharacterized protein n=1 Tax=Moorena producens 3L TaxID=489825 RepID=F4XUC0_9CYAN|nr:MULTISPECIES: hypothetical protein [Moorena]EGJ31745.1 hypothetical protein LYNGBM3L_32680 [Moorena producens 3L]NEP31371.1 hypothetical protein [Moorena sp. SIO3B2]NEP66521.1 hypothetical protein [Moorena sp. SIO3A5]NER86279.1 hypothetical protein [Moorena sp. SIO3A2]OLT63768.1 hypothetical protein BI334_00900 [Moorena producens 3L]
MAKKYWEFLLQKEGERSWKPIKSSEMEIESGRYRIVARSNRPNTDVEICVSYDSTEQVPPKRKSQKRWRRTNSEGLMVVIPFTKLKPGLWKLRCSNDIMDDFLGESWRKSLALQVIPKVKDVETPPKTSVSSSVAESTPVESTPVESTPVESTPVEATPVEVTETDTQPPQLDNSLSTPELAVDSPSTNTIANDLKVTDASSDARSELSNPQEYESQITPPEQQPITIAAPELPVDQAQAPIGVSPEESSPSPETVLEEVEEVYPEAPVNSETNQQLTATISEDLPLQSTVENSIMEESLETLEQLLQQVLQPVLDELEDRESEDNQQLRKTSDSDWVSDTDVNQYGLTLRLDKEIFLAKRGESLTIKGALVVDNDKINNNGDSITVSVLDSVLENLFPATLRYQLRFPQTGKRLLDIEYSLSQEELFLGFSHSLDIPTDCQSGLILGKITLYNSQSTPLATQQFTVTANVEDLLEVIVPGNQGMPMETMVVLANRIAQSAKPDQPDQDLLLLDEYPLEETTLDLVELPQNHPSLFLQPISGRSLPPKLYQHQPSDITVKSLELPNLPTMQSVADPEAKHEDVQDQSKGSDSVSLDDQESSTTANPELNNREQDTGSELQPQDTVVQDTVVQDTVVQDTLVQDTLVQDTVEQSKDSTKNTTEDSNLEINSEVSSNSNDASEVLINSLTESEAIQTIEISEIDQSQTDVQLEDSESLDTQFKNSKLNQLLNTTRWETPDSVQDPESIALEDAFRALNMEERFWSRLSALAEDDELMELLRLELSPESNPAGQDHSAVEDEQRNQTASNQEEVREFPEKVLESMTESEDLSLVSSELAMPKTPPRVGITSHDWSTQEIVVDDIEIAPQATKATATKQHDVKAKLENLSSLELDATLTAPTLSIPTTRELVAGEKVMVTIKLPPSQSRLCIKLWVKDVQTRSLLQETRSIIDLLPNAAGELEAMTQLVIPEGTTQIRIEAIAINLENQQESHKAELECVVVPTDLSSTVEG